VNKTVVPTAVFLTFVLVIDCSNQGKVINHSVMSEYLIHGKIEVHPLSYGRIRFRCIKKKRKKKRKEGFENNRLVSPCSSDLPIITLSQYLKGFV
jgi:hypothetical protein